MRAIRVIGILILGVLSLTLGGCRDKYHVTIRIPQGSSITKGGGVYIDGVEVGTVDRLLLDGQQREAVLVFKKEGIARAKMRIGVVVYARADGGLDVDASKVAADAQPLESGTVVELASSSAVDVWLRKYGQWQTIIAAIAGSVVMVVLTWVTKAILRMGVVLVSLLLAAVVAWILMPVLSPVVETQIYPKLAAYSQAHRNEADSQSDAPSTIKAHVADMPHGVSKGQEIIMQPLKLVAVQVQNTPLPNPQMVAFLLSWLICFILFQIVLGFALRSTRKSN